MQPTDLKHKDVVQVNPDLASMKEFGGCLVTVTDCLSWGIYGYVTDLNQRGKDTKPIAWYRAGFEEIEYVGKAPFSILD